MVMEDTTQGGEHTMQDTHDVLQNCTPTTYIILFASVTTINSIKQQFEETEQASVLKSEMAGKLEILDNELKNMIDMLKALMGNMGNIQEQMYNVDREIENLEKE